MIRGADKVALSLRRKNGDVENRVDPHRAWRERHPALKWAVIRGAITLIESLVLGIRYLNLSADAAMADEKGGEAAKKTFKDTVLQWLSMGFALLVGVGLFMYTPMFLTDFIRKDQNPALFNLSAGAIRFVIFFLYLFLISKMKDVKRVFEYHGAEHKAIFAYEAGKTVTVDSARPYRTHHPRCGTSFLLIAGFSCVIVFAFLDFAVISLYGPYASVLHRMGAHLLMVPLVSGISYEVLRFSGEHCANPVIGKLILPGLWIQKITTSEPDDRQLEVAVAAVNNAL